MELVELICQLLFDESAQVIWGTTESELHKQGDDEVETQTLNEVTSELMLTGIVCIDGMQVVLLMSFEGAIAMTLAVLLYTVVAFNSPACPAKTTRALMTSRIRVDFDIV